METPNESKWRLNGVRVVHGHELDGNTPQTAGMNRAAAINYARAGAEKLWAGTVVIHPKAKTGAHHHGPVESVIYVVSGRARIGGVIVSNSLPKRARAISSSYRPLCRIRKSTPATTSRFHACSCEADRNPLSSTLTFRWQNSPRKCSGLTIFTKRPRSSGTLFQFPAVARA